MWAGVSLLTTPTNQDLGHHLQLLLLLLHLLGRYATKCSWVYLVNILELHTLLSLLMATVSALSSWSPTKTLANPSWPVCLLQTPSYPRCTLHTAATVVPLKQGFDHHSLLLWTCQWLPAAHSCTSYSWWCLSEMKAKLSLTCPFPVENLDSFLDKHIQPHISAERPEIISGNCSSGSVDRNALHLGRSVWSSWIKGIRGI